MMGTCGIINMMTETPDKNIPMIINAKLSGRNTLGPIKKLLIPHNSMPRDDSAIGSKSLTINGIIKPIKQNPNIKIPNIRLCSFKESVKSDSLVDSTGS